jgi:hypothetical protein
MADERYAVVSCHVERPLDDRVWAAFAQFQASLPAGFRVAALMRPPEADAGDDAETWLARARWSAEQGPLGHHTHWGGPSQARPRGGDPAEKVRREGEWLRSAGLTPTFFCGGGWYFDAAVAEAVADLGYVDCTGRPARPRQLEPTAAWLEADEPCLLRLGGRDVLELPTTHSIGELARAVWRPRLSAVFVHAYFHDTDLLDRRRAAALRVALAVLARRRRAIDLDGAATVARAQARKVNPAFAR